jgi:anaphase-promoting complex subunit 3
MSPANPYVAQQLRQLIYYHLDCNLLRNALFFAGRLQAYEPRASEAAYLLSLCHLKLGQFKAAYDTSKNAGSRGTHLGCSYVYAQACLALERYSEGITALERSKTLWTPRNNWNKHTETRRHHLPDASAAYCLMGKLAHAYGDTNRAIECYQEALKLNSFMWDAFLALCDLGANVRIPNVFKITPAMMSIFEDGTNDETSLGVLEDTPPLDSLPSKHTKTELPAKDDPFNPSTIRANGTTRTNITKSALFEKLNGSTNMVTPIVSAGKSFGLDTPTDVPTQWGSNTTSATDSGAIEPPLAPARKPRALAGLGLDVVEEPPRIRPKYSHMKSQTSGESDDLGDTISSFTSNISSGITDRKRTNSGQVAQTSSRTIENPIVNDPMAPQRRSVRLFNQIRPHSSKLASSTGSFGTKDGRELKKAKAIGTKGRSINMSTVGRVVSGNRKPTDPMDIDTKEVRPSTSHVSAPPEPKPVSDKMRRYEALQVLLDLFTKLGSGYFALSHYQCEEALKIFNSIPLSQRESPWVLSKIGRCMFEQANWSEAEKQFQRIRSMAPSTIEDMEIYSSVLWQMKTEVDLAFLAHEVLDIDRLSPQAWCAVGNSFSLQREHDQAIKCFKRATQLDPKFAYAWTLQGHEHVANEEYDKALAAYRSGIAAEKRHYNAWWGLGKVYEHQGKFLQAETHYRTASLINPTNAVLVFSIGKVLETVKNPKAALVMYARSLDLDPKSAQPRFRKAVVLLGLGLAEESYKDLAILNDTSPDDANVHFWTGKCLRVLKRSSEAVKSFTIALNLDPKVCNSISNWRSSQKTLFCQESHGHG